MTTREGKARVKAKGAHLNSPAGFLAAGFVAFAFLALAHFAFFLEMVILQKGAQFGHLRIKESAEDEGLWSGSAPSAIEANPV